MTERLQRFLSAVAFLAVFHALAAFSWAEERITDEELQKLFGKTHNVMRDQRQRMQAILDGFLTGNAGMIRRNTDEVARDMEKIDRAIPPKPGQEAEVWKAMAEISQHAKLLQQNVGLGRYREAYGDFSKMTSSCIDCHQARRIWGTFPEPKQTEPKTDKPSKKTDKRETSAE